MIRLKCFAGLAIAVAIVNTGFAEALETCRWQAEIDRVAVAGGGTVTVPAGRHVTGTLFLKSNVTLELAAGCVLEGSTNRVDYPDIHIEYAELREPWQGLVVADGQTNVAVVGTGEIFGNGKAFGHGVRLGRPQGLLFHKCRGVRVEGVRLRDLARWTCYLKECDGCVFRKVTVDSHANANNDGIDIDSRNVLVEDCDFDSDDDGIVFKSDNADFIVENVTVRNCRVKSTCSAIKLGTGSHGGFRNILIENIEAGASPREWCDAEGRGVISGYRVRCWPGSGWTPSLLSGIALECVDGGVMENVTVRNVTVARAATPIFIRGGLRRGRKWGDSSEPVDLKLPFGRHCRVRNILIENVKTLATSFTASSITGVPGLRLTDITLRNVDIEVPGAGEAGRVELGKAVPECVDGYPESNMFDARMLPAYGFYIRHADGVTFDNVNVRVKGTELRPRLVQEDVTGFTECGVAARPWTDPEEMSYYNHVWDIAFTNDVNGFRVRRFWFEKDPTCWVDCNFDERAVKPYTLDDPFTFLDGRKVETKDDWRKRRAEILELFQSELYGRLPPPPEALVVEKTSERISDDGFSVIRRYRLRFRKDGTGPAVDWLVFLPRFAKGRVPVFLHLNYKGFGLVEQGRTNHYTLPLEHLAARGYAFMTAHYTQITGDPRSQDEWNRRAYDGVFELWGKRDPKRTDNPGTIMAWAWGLMRGLDLAERIPEVDAERSVVIGSSRLGKTALVAAAFDERFKVCIANQTGAVGVQVMKRNFGENAKIQHRIFPHWYCKGFWKYEDDPSQQKFDQHLLLACVAPRALLLECFQDEWYDPKGEFVSARAASPVWKFLCGKGLPCETIPETFTSDSVKQPFGYATRSEAHGLSGYDWMWALDFADAALSLK